MSRFASAARLAFRRYFGIRLEEKADVMMLTHRDELEVTQNPVFHVEKNKTNRVQPSTYQLTMNARMFQQRAQQELLGM
jgi:hypothetical protein